MNAKITFEMRTVQLPLESILPIHQIKDPQKSSRRYKTILASLREIGQVEPLVVHPQKDKPEQYVLLNGHLRHFALQQLGKTSADCLVATDDECYTYNARVNRISPIQEHRMILKAVNNGVSEKRLAAALNVPCRVITASLNLLSGIHEEAVELLKNKSISAPAIRRLKRVNGQRQIEIAELMVAANNYTIGYAKALVLGSKNEQLANPEAAKPRTNMSAEDRAKMQQELESLESDLKTASENYSENMYNLTCARGYIKKLLENAKITRFFNMHYPDMLLEFETIVAAELV
jgi:ParB-like chromosome segregation protein Spo0J